MPGHVVSIWRHPIKGHGREEMAAVDLRAGQTIAGDRAWAVLHEAARTKGGEWAPCANFSRGSQTPALQGIRATTRADGRMVLTHPDLAEITIDPARDSAAFVAWVTPLVDPKRAQPRALVPAGARGMTDTDYASVSLINLASHRTFEQTAGRPLNVLRWRGNLLVDGLAPWEEFDWIGREVRIGAATLRIREPIVRCNATRADPATGKVDFDTLALLNTRWGHQDFGVYAEVTAPGAIEAGASVTLA